PSLAALPPNRRGHVDDTAAPSLHHDPRNGLGCIVGAAEIDPEDLIPVRYWILGETDPWPQDSRVIDQHIDFPETTDGEIHKCFCLAARPDIGFPTICGPSAGLNRLHRSSEF